MSDSPGGPLLSKLDQIAIGLFTLAVIGGIAYFLGYTVGYDHGQSGSSLEPGGQNCTAVNCSAISEEPVINLYPAQAEQVSVQVSYPAGFSYTSPAYNPASGWQVMATPSGQLTTSDGAQYPYLIWEGNPAPLSFNMNEGFVVSGGQTEGFLRHQLPQIGLSPSETDAFITYWLPKMRGNKYNLIHFAGKEYTDYAKLRITPQPDSMLRVYMAFQPLQQPVAVTPQTFPPFQRTGFAAVEWGGAEL